jgi:FKBP-type peptidyl-prolyl cis-trans isomerase
MKQVFLFISALMIAGVVMAQTGTAVKKPVVATPLKTTYDSACYVMGLSFANYYKGQGIKKVNPVVVSKAINDVFGKDKTDSSSYAMGMNFAQFYKQQGITKVNTTIITRAINDIFAGKKPLLDDQAANSVMNAYITSVQKEKSAPNIILGENFLKQNKTKPGVKTTASGLQYEVITEGTGAKPTASDSVTCHYRGTFINNPVPFDDSYSRGQPITFHLGRVIPGWTEGLQLMSIGSKYKFYIPYQLGYGAMDYMSIPGGSMLIFDVELLDIKKQVAAVPPTGNN